MNAIYESDRLLDEYLLFHYGTAEEILPHPGGPVEALDFAVRTVVENVSASPRTRALDLGCAVGRSSFELSRFCAGVVGIDYSQKFIQAAIRLRNGETLPYRRHEAAHRFTSLSATIPEGTHPERIRFETGDAMALPPDLGRFDLIHAANLICRLSEPERTLAQFPLLTNPGGTLIITTPSTWLGEFTPPDRWPPGPTLDWLKSHLQPHFSLTSVRDQSFLIREHARKYQWSVAQASVWLRHF
jgi:putative 4-mercaptohistidine N1-methyltranferase